MSELTDEERDWLEKFGSSMHDVGACIDWIIKFRRELSAKDKEITDLKKQLYPGDIKRSSEGTCYCAECERKAKEIEELKKMLGLWVCRLDWGPEYSSDYLFVYAQSKEEALTILKNSEIDTNAVSFTLRQIDDLKKGVLWDSRDPKPPQQ